MVSASWVSVTPKARSRALRCSASERPPVPACTDAMGTQRRRGIHLDRSDPGEFPPIPSERNRFSREATQVREEPQRCLGGPGNEVGSDLQRALAKSSLDLVVGFPLKELVPLPRGDSASSMANQACAELGRPTQRSVQRDQRWTLIGDPGGHHLSGKRAVSAALNVGDCHPPVRQLTPGQANRGRLSRAVNADDDVQLVPPPVTGDRIPHAASAPRCTARIAVTSRSTSASPNSPSGPCCAKSVNGDSYSRPGSIVPNSVS